MNISIYEGGERGFFSLWLEDIAKIYYFLSSQADNPGGSDPFFLYTGCVKHWQPQSRILPEITHLHPVRRREPSSACLAHKAFLDQKGQSIRGRGHTSCTFLQGRGGEKRRLERPEDLKTLMRHKQQHLIIRAGTSRLGPGSSSCLIITE